MQKAGASADHDHMVVRKLIATEQRMVSAYRALLARLSPQEDRGRIEQFLHHHEQHLHELGTVGRLPGPRWPTAPVVRAQIVLSRMLGDKAMLWVIKRAERKAREAYRRARGRRGTSAELRVVLARLAADERIHHAWLAERVGAM